MGSIVSKVLGGGGAKAAAPAPAPAPVVQPKPVVTPSPVVNVGDKGGNEKAAKKKIRRGMSRQRVPSTVMGQAPTATKTLLGQ